MKVYQNTHSNVLPEDKVIDAYSVWIASDIHTVEVKTAEDEEARTEYVYTLTQYDKDEYIALMDDRNAALEAELTDTQLALTELYEALA